MHRIRLLYLITDLNVGGVPLHVFRLATSLPNDRFDIQVVSLADVGPVGDRLTAAGIPVHACRARNARDWRALVRLRRLIRDIAPDILHSLLFHANMAARIVAPLAGLSLQRVLCEIQTVELDQHWHLWLDGMTCRWCRFTVGNSPSVVAHLHAAAHIPDSRLRLFTGGVDIDNVASAVPAQRAPLAIPETAPLVFWAGRMDPVKGLDDLLDAFAIVRKRFPAFLMLAGSGDYEAAVRQRIAMNQLQDCVKLPGRRDDIASLLATADVFAFPSHTEGMPNALLEAMAAGKAIVTTRVAGCRDLIQNHETGLLVPPRNVKELADAICLLLRDTQLRSRLGSAAREHVRAYHDWHDISSRWADCYEHIAAQTQPRATDAKLKTAPQMH